MVRHQQMCEREKLPETKKISKCLKLQEEISGAIEELLEEDKINIIDINNLIRCSHNRDTNTE